MRRESRAKEKKAEKGKDNKCEKSSRRLGDLGQGRESSEVRSRGEKASSRKFYKWIKVFGKKQLERMPTRKIWDHAIDTKEEFILRKRKVYPLLRKEREEV